MWKSLLLVYWYVVLWRILSLHSGLLQFLRWLAMDSCVFSPHNGVSFFGKHVRWTSYDTQEDFFWCERVFWDRSDLLAFPDNNLHEKYWFLLMHFLTEQTAESQNSFIPAACSHTLTIPQMIITTHLHHCLWLQKNLLQLIWTVHFLFPIIHVTSNLVKCQHILLLWNVF